MLCLDGPAPSGEPFCSACAASLAEERSRPACPTCGSDVAPYEVRLDRCATCRGRAWKIGGTARIGPYGPALGHIFRAYKYDDREELGLTLGEWLVEAVRGAAWLDRVEAVVSVPTHWRHRLDRRFHAADVLAAHLAKRLRRPHAPILRRVRAGRHQVGSSFVQRAANVRGAFAPADGVELREARLLLVDDVRTTGATIEECAKVLRKNGASEVYAAVILSASHTSANNQTLNSF
jgi:ComF family protein